MKEEPLKRHRRKSNPKEETDNWKMSPQETREASKARRTSKKTQGSPSRRSRREGLKEEKEHEAGKPLPRENGILKDQGVKETKKRTHSDRRKERQLREGEDRQETTALR